MVSMFLCVYVSILMYLSRMQLYLAYTRVIRHILTNTCIPVNCPHTWCMVCIVWSLLLHIYLYKYIHMYYRLAKTELAADHPVTERLIALGAVEGVGEVEEEEEEE